VCPQSFADFWQSAGHLWFTFTHGSKDISPVTFCGRLRLPSRLGLLSPIDCCSPREAAGQTRAPTPPTDLFQVFAAQALADDAKELQATPGNQSLVDGKALTVKMAIDDRGGKERRSSNGTRDMTTSCR
jgi:hypothetical protein